MGLELTGVALIQEALELVSVLTLEHIVDNPGVLHAEVACVTQEARCVQIDRFLSRQVPQGVHLLVLSQIFRQVVLAARKDVNNAWHVRSFENLKIYKIFKQFLNFNLINFMQPHRDPMLVLGSSRQAR